MNSNDSYLMYIVVRTDIKMSPGKMGAQIGHGVQYICEAKAQACWGSGPCSNYWEETLRNYDAWRKSGGAKIVLKANESEWKKILQLSPCIVRDAGHTELEPGIETVAAFWPVKKSERPKVLQRLRLL